MSHHGPRENTLLIPEYRLAHSVAPISLIYSVLATKKDVVCLYRLLCTTVQPRDVNVIIRRRIRRLQLSLNGALLSSDSGHSETYSFHRIHIAYPMLRYY